MIPWHFHFMAILALKRFSAAATSNVVSPAQIQKHCAKCHSERDYDDLRQSLATYCSLSKHCSTCTRYYNRLTIFIDKKTHIECLSRQESFAAREVIDILLHLSVYITTNSFSDIPQHLSKHMAVAHADLTPPIIYDCRRMLSDPIAIETLLERKFGQKPLKTIIPVSNESDVVVHYKALVGLALQRER